MTFEIGLLLAIIALALVFFWREIVPADVVGLGVLLALILTGLLPARDAFAGFGSDTVMMILGLLILTAALARTGMVEIAGRAILRHTGTEPNRLLLVLMLATAGLSAFISNTAATAFFLPVTVGLAARAHISPSKLLLPLAFSSILTSSVTLISTSTNIVVSGLMTQHGLAPMGVFELAPVGVPIAIVGILYMLTIGRRLLPAREREADASGFGLRSYLTEALVQPRSPLVGKSLAEAGLGRDLDLTVLRVVRGGKNLPARSATRLEAGDVLLVEGERSQVLKIKDEAGIDIKADVTLGLPGAAGADVRLVEAILLPSSTLVGASLTELGFRERYGLQVLAIHRHEATLRSQLSRVRLRVGDVLLVQGEREAIAQAEQGGAYRVLGAVEETRPNYPKAGLAVAIFVAALAAATFELLSLPVAVLLGALLVFLTRCIAPEEAYREVEWRVLILIGSMLALGRAMETTGTAEYLAGLIVDLVGLSGAPSPLWLLAGFFVLTVVLTQPMSNQAAATVVLPVAIQTALALDLNPRTFAMMVAVAASCSYLTPLEPSCLMVYGPGRYHFGDFLRVGALLTVLIFVIALLLVPRVWPLAAAAT